jgi:hypothetical protein
MIVRPFDTVSRLLAASLLCLACLALGWFLVKRADKAGYARALQAAVVHQPRLVDTVRVLTMKTDTVLLRAARQASRVESVTVRVSQIIRDSIPVVDTLVIESQALAKTVVTLRGDVLTERAARESLFIATTLITVAKQDSIAFLVRRPTKKRAAFYGMLALGVGYVLGGHR